MKGAILNPTFDNIWIIGHSIKQITKLNTVCSERVRCSNIRRPFILQCIIPKIGVKERNWLYTSSNGDQKKFFDFLRGVKSFLTSEGEGSKSLTPKIFKLLSNPSPHQNQSICEQSLDFLEKRTLKAVGITSIWCCLRAMIGQARARDVE